MTDATTTELLDALNVRLDADLDFGLFAMPSTFDQGKKWWTNTQSGRPSSCPAANGTIVTVSGIGQVLQMAGDGQGAAPSLYQRGYMPVIADHTYRSTLRIRQTVNDANIGSRVYHGISCYASDWSYLGDIVFAAEDTDLQVADGWQTYIQTTDAATVWGTYSTAAFIRSRARPNCDGSGNEGDGTVQIAGLRLENLGVGLGTASTAALDTDGTMAANSDTRVPSQKSVVTYVAARISALLNGVSSSFDTLLEIANELALKAPLASPALTGNPTAPTQSAGNNSTRIATTAYADGLVSDVAYDATSWNGVGGIAPSKNAVRDQIEAVKATTVSGGGLATGGGDLSTNRTITVTAASDTEARSMAATNRALTPANLAARTSFSAHKNGVDQTSVGAAGFAKVTFGSEDWDEGGSYDTTNSRFTPPAGKYRLCATVEASGLNAAPFMVAIYKNGAEWKRGPVASTLISGAARMSVTVNVTANGTDYFEVYVYGGTSGTYTIVGTATLTHFQGEAV